MQVDKAKDGRTMEADPAGRHHQEPKGVAGDARLARSEATTAQPQRSELEPPGFCSRAEAGEARPDHSGRCPFAASVSPKGSWPRPTAHLGQEHTVATASSGRQPAQDREAEIKAVSG